MRNIVLLLIIMGFYCSCDTNKKPSPVAVMPQSTYVSPPVATDASVLTPSVVAPLPADSLPVEYSARGIAAAPPDFLPMMGKWQSTYDEGEVVHFLPGRYVSYYDDQMIVEEKMTYYHVCPETCIGNDGLEQPCFVLASDYDQQCFAILSRTDSRLELSLISGDGMRLVYQRVEGE